MKDITNGSSIVRKSGSYTSKKHQTDQSYYYAFDVLFDQSVYLEENKTYEIVSLITGPHSWFGFYKGNDSVECGGVLFSFSNSNAAEPKRTFVSKASFPLCFFGNLKLVLVRVRVVFN